MSTLENYLLSAASAASSQFWLDVALKATALLLAAMLGTALLRRSSAALRHRVWCLTFAALALLPTLSAALPQWRLAILPARIEQRPAVETMPTARTETARPIALGAEAAINEPTAYDEEALTQVQSKFAGDRITSTPQSLPPAADDQPAASLDAPRLLGPASIWLLGAAIALLPLVVGSVRTMFLRRQSRPIDDAGWGDLLGELCRRLALRRTVALFETASALMPMTWGLLRPIVLLPAQARCWSNQLRRVVLLHELAHVKRCDVGFQMLARATCAVYWFHPLAWYALRRLRIERELACDDCVVHAGERASDYAAELLEVARACQPVPLAAAVAMAQRSGLEHRIRTLFDSACSHLPLSARAARLLLVGVTVLATTIAAVRLVPRASAADERQDSSDNAASQDDDLIIVSGRVVDPQGKPFADANIFAVRWYWEPHIPHAPLAETKSSADGRFVISYRKSQFDIDLGRPDQWKEVAIVAAAKGFGPGWVTRRDIPAGQSPTLKLVPDDAPISGRIVDLEGNPIAGVRVRVGDIYNGKEGNLDGWLQAVRHGEFPWTAARYLGDSLPQFDAWPPRAVTAEDGRFMIHGIGRERRVQLTLNGATIAYQQVTAVTRPCKPLQLKVSSMSDESTPVYGADFELVAPPTQPIVGVVRDADTGQPLGGVSIESNQFAGSNYINERQLRAVSDEQGRYRLVGMPKGKGNVLLAVPNDDQPYLMREFKVLESRGLEPVELDIELHRGVWITGRVTDKSTGEPLMARLYYLPFRTNEYAQQTPEFGEMGRGHGFQDRYSSRPDGSFRLVGLPGRAIVGALCVIGHYRDGVGAEAIEGMNDRGNFPTFRNPVEPGRKWPHAMQEINPPTGAESVECDLALDPGGKITVKVQNREGKPVSGFKTIGSGQTTYGEEIERTSFDVITLGPDERRTVVIRHKPQKLGKVVQLRLADHPTGSATLTLEPTAKVVGRLLDKQGEPVSGAEITAWVLPIEDFGERLPPVTTDEQGRFEYDDIPLGCRYQLDANAAAMRGLVASDLAVAPGETKDLGDVKIGGREQTLQEPTAAKPEKDQCPTVRLVDPAGQPLAGAWVGEGACGDSAARPVWSPYSPKGESRADGRAQIVGRALRKDRILLYARHAAQDLAALRGFSREDLLGAPDLVLQPACRVYGELTSAALVKAGRELEWTNVYLWLGDDRPLSFMSKQQRFEFHLPPGKYRLSCYGTDTLAVDREIEVAAGRRELHVGAIDLPATKLATLIGKPAPELRDIKAWKNGPGASLAELRGKYILLDFWGHWCGPCVREMPHLMKLHDAFADRGLEVIAIHDASVESIAEMDRSLQMARQREWWGRDLPFRVALDGATPTATEASTGEHGRGAMTDAYGISSFPTTLLIDRQGRIVKQVSAFDARLPDELADLLGAAGRLPTWRAGFDQVYRLAPGETLRRVPPPFIAERVNFLTERNSLGGAGSWPARMTVAWNGVATMSGSGGDSLMELLASFAGQGQPRDLFDCRADLAQRQIPGDWLVAGEAPLANRLQTLESLLQKELGMRVRFERQQVEREVIAVSGQYRFMPLRRDDQYLHVSTGDQDLDDVCGGGAGGVAQLLEWLTGFTGSRFVGEELHAPEGELQWHQHPSTILAKPFPPQEFDKILDNLARQTSLKFERQRRAIEIWKVCEEL